MQLDKTIELVQGDGEISIKYDTKPVTIVLKHEKRTVRVSVTESRRRDNPEK
jgi:hypothetical protein